MPRIPDSPDQIFDTFTQDVQRIFGKDLVSIVLFGSGARGQYVPKKSDINFMVVLTQAGIERLNEALEIVDKWRKVNVAVPLYLTGKYIETALDTFPIEFLDMKHFHKLVYGEDLLANIEIDKDDLRQQIERELRGKLIQLRGSFLSTGNNREALHDMLSASVTTFVSIFEGLLHLKDAPLPNAKGQVLVKTAELFGLDPAPFASLMNIKAEEWRGSKVQLQDVAMAYIGEIKKLVEIVDKM